MNGGSYLFGGEPHLYGQGSFHDQVAGVWVVADASNTPTDTKTDGNKSPKTFDAGIAMYVGMALTSVAGSAVVIGKKKEF